MGKSKPAAGTIGWHDLTVADADRTRRFYEQVIGWTSQPVSMGDYDDYSMMAADGTCVAGICHARGKNAALPPQWLVYIHVDNLHASLEAVEREGGAVVCPARHMAGYGTYAVIRDPAGAVCALFEAEGGTDDD